MSNQPHHYNGGEPGSIVAALIDLQPIQRKGFRDLCLILEALILTVVSIYAVRLIGVPQPGLVGIVLSSSAMIPRMNQILLINRDRIWREQGNGRQINLDSIGSGLSIFIGMFIGFLGIGFLSSESVMIGDFNFIITRAGLDPNAVLSADRFSQGLQIFQHNSSVLITLTALSFVYRSLGTMFALGWNAGVWGITIALFMNGGDESDLAPVMYGAMILIAIMPHLIFEASSYLTGALAAIFLSRGITLYSIGDSRLNRVLIAVVVLGVLSLALLLIGAVLEHHVPRIILDQL
tara:strand:- start:839 stop:1714 length:876 start_codon:yes stop_codon:yes gene_type:complete